MAYKMLVIDDHDDARQMLRIMLECLGNEVDDAAHGNLALDIIAQKRPDILLLDYSMPGMSGAEVARRARQIWPDLPILFVTAHGNLLADVDPFVAHTDILAKPFTMDVLKHRVAAVLH